MRAFELKPEGQALFEPFSIQVDIESIDQLRAFERAAVRMANGHGVELHELLKRKLDRFEVEAALVREGPAQG